MSPKTISAIVKLFGWFEGILRKRPSEVKVIIVLLGLVWATNLIPPMVQYEKEHPNTTPIVEQHQTASRGLIFMSHDELHKLLPWAEEGWEKWFSRMLNWLPLIYLRSLLLVILFYLYRMANRKGVLKTILAGKFRFVLAIAFWPIMIFRYPYNVVREIVVATELRRMGNAFRVFSSREWEIVRIKASGSKSDFRRWRRDFQIVHAGDFRRGFSLALVITIVMVLITPLLSHAQGNSPPEKAWGFCLVVNSTGPPGACCLKDLTDNPTNPDHHDWGSDVGTAVLPSSFLYIRMSIVGVVESLCALKPPSIVHLVFYIPKLSPVFVLR